MAAQIISLVQRLRPPPVRDWTPQEVAEFYRVESSLLQAGLALDSERGMSDEGDPWFVFCRTDTGEVFIHFARVDGEYVVDGAAFGSAARGHDFTALVRDLIGRHPLAATRRSGSNVFLHPAALLIALVGAAFFHSGHAKAAEVGAHDAAPATPKAEGRRGFLFNAGGPAPAAGTGEVRSVTLDPAEVAAVLTGVAIGLRQASASATVAGSAAPDPVIGGFVGSSAPHLAERPSLSSAHGGGDLVQLAGAQARAALTVMAVFADMARAASAAAASPIGAAPVESPAAVPQAQLVLTAPPAAEAPQVAPPAGARPLLIVQLSEGPLPQIAAVRLLIDNPELAKVSQRAVHVEDLPVLLADLISHGQLVDLSTPPVVAVPAPVDLGTAPPAQTAPSTDAGHHDGAPHAGAPQDGGLATPVAPAPVETPPPADASPPAVVTPTPVAPTLHVWTVTDVIVEFLTHVPNAQLMVSEHGVVFYDPILSQALQGGQLVESITYALDDGSSVSLVGLAPDLHALHGVG